MDRKLSDYEKLREAKIARNNARLSSLGLLNAAEKMRSTVKGAKDAKKKPKAAKKTTPPSKRRTSSRISKKPDALVVGGPGYFKAEKISSSDCSDDESSSSSAIESKSEEIISKMRLEMETMRKNSGVDATKLPCLNSKEEDYRNQAVELWGKSCCPPPSCSWKTFVESRLPTPSPDLPSPLCLMQELYTHDGWTFLCSCVLMTRVSSHDTKDRCIKGFFDLCPKPSDFANLPMDKLKDTINR